MEEFIQNNEQRWMAQERIIQQLSANLAQVTTVMSELVSKERDAPIPTPTAVPMVTTRTAAKPKISLPPKFSGDTKVGKAWVFSVRSYLSYHDLLFSADGVSVIASLLQGDLS